MQARVTVLTGISRFVLRHARAVLIIGILLTVAGGYYSALLYSNLKLDLTELLPSDARSVRDMHQVKGRLKATDTLTLIVDSNHPKESRRFIDDLARELEKAPKDLIASVEYRIDRELRFFDRRKALYLDIEDLRKIRDLVMERIEYEKELRNPLNIFNGIEIPEPKLDLRILKQNYDERISAYTRFPDGYYATPDERRRVMLIYKAGPSTEIDRLKLLKDIVDDAIAKLRPTSYAPDIQIHFTGDVQNMIEEQSAILADLQASTTIVSLAEMAALLIFFRSFIATFSLIASVTMGTLWTMGAAYFMVGSLNANSAFLASIVLGNGINFGVILTARYLEERRMGVDAPLSLRMAMIRSASATWTAALAAGLSYGSLMLTSFRGFRQFGIIGFVGMVLCWISAFTVLPALLQFLMNRRSIQGVSPAAPATQKSSLPTADPSGAIPSGTKAPAFHSFIFSTLVKILGRYPVPVLIGAALITAFCVLQLSRITPDLLETDLTRLRSRQSLERGSAYYANEVDEVFRRYLSPVVVLPEKSEDTEAIAEKLRQIQREVGPSSMIASVQTIHDFVPNNQAEKIQIIREIRSLLPRRIIRELSPRERRLAQSFLTPESLRPVRVEDLPPLVLDRFRETDGTVGRMVLVTPPITADIRLRENLFRFIRLIREGVDSVSPGAPVAGTLPVTADMFESVLQDGPKATLLAFSSVIVLVSLLFRNFKQSTLVLSSLFIGVIWLCGIAISMGVKVNFLNFIALPIAFGIGVDYGVNIVQRYLQDGRGSILKVVGSTGAAVGLCSLTTIIGYSSLLTADNLAFFSFGLLAVMGELTCSGAALAVIPSLLELRDRKLTESHKLKKEQSAA